LSHPIVKESEQLTSIVTRIAKYRKLHTLLTFFVRPYQAHQVNGIMHPDYNQSVRTARMSCRRPNAQQLSPEAKGLIIPRKNCDFVSYDYSQIEFRLIVHFIKAADAIASYTDDPYTDFHTWVSNMCSIPRKPAKNINFAIAFGGGKARVITMLSSNMELMGNLGEAVRQCVEEGQCPKSKEQELFDYLRMEKGKKVFNEYHATLPTLRTTTTKAGKVLKTRGYVFNAYGRERRLPEKAAFRAFNAIVQSSAADIMKERTVATAPRYNSYVRNHGIVQSASVHDETLMTFPKEISRDPKILLEIKKQLEDTEIEFRVPIKSSCGWSDKNWQIASGDEGAFDPLSLDEGKLIYEKDIK